LPQSGDETMLNLAQRKRRPMGIHISKGRLALPSPNNAIRFFRFISVIVSYTKFCTIYYMIQQSPSLKKGRLLNL